MNQTEETLPLPVDVPVASPATNEAETVEIQSLDTFVKLLTGWHHRKVAVLEHYLKLEGGIEMQVGDEPSFKLEGDILQGMKAGIQLALMEFGNLPFSFELEEAGSDSAQPAPANAVQP